MPEQLQSGHMGRLYRVLNRRAGTFRLAVQQARREGGRTAAVREIGALLTNLAAWPAFRWYERRHDERLRVVTGADAGAWSRPAHGPEAGIHGDGVAYSPTPLHLLRSLLRRLPIDRPADYAFVDLGCGKGRTLFVAAERGFRPVVGVELDPRLADVARDNVRAFMSAAPGHDRPVSIVVCDASTYDFPAAPLVVYLFNAFGAGTLQAVVANLRRSMAVTPRHVVVAYFNPVHRRVLDACPELRLTATARHWAIYATTT